MKVSKKPVSFLPPYRPKGPRANGEEEDEGTLEDILGLTKTEETKKKPKEAEKKEGS